MQLPWDYFRNVVEISQKVTSFARIGVIWDHLELLAGLEMSLIISGWEFFLQVFEEPHVWLHGILVSLKVLVSSRKFSRKIAQELLLLLLDLKQYVVLLFVVLLNDITKIKLFTIFSLELLKFVDVL